MIRKLPRRTRVDPNELDRQTAEVLSKLETDGPKMAMIASWLNWRTNENGFGEDFDITIIPRKA